MIYFTFLFFLGVSIYHFINTGLATGAGYLSAAFMTLSYIGLRSQKLELEKIIQRQYGASLLRNCANKGSGK